MIVWPHVLSAAAAAVLVTAGAGSRPTTTTATGDPPYAAGALGQDISYPQCAGLPSSPVAFGIVGVTHGRPFTQNPCLGAEAAWARSFRPEVDVYFNLDYSPADAAAHGGVGPAGLCGDGDLGCLAYNYGSNTAEDAIAYAASQQVTPRMWWLDVETGNNWADDVNVNNAVINGAIAALQHHGATVGVYSAAFMWTSITGGVHNGLPAWVAGPASLEATPSYCSPAQSFTGGPVWLVQYPAPVDGDYACGGSTRQYLVTADGGVFAAALPFRGSAGDQRLNAPVVGIATTRSGNGYWLMSADGGIFAYGDAAYHGSLGANGPPAPAVGIAVTGSGNGYWLATADGGVYTYGDAAFHGSLGGLGLAAPIVGIAATASGNGYWLVSADGGVFTYGDAVFHGSLGAGGLAAPIVGIAVSASGNGYWLASADGGVFAYGDARWQGSAGGGGLATPVVGISRAADGSGYRLALAGGGVLSFTGTPFYAPVGAPVNGPVTGLAEPPLPPPPPPPPPPDWRMETRARR